MKTKASTKVDWDKIDLITSTSILPSKIPENGITARMIADRYKCSPSTASSKLNKLLESDQFEEISVKIGRHITRVAVPV